MVHMSKVRKCDEQNTFTTKKYKYEGAIIYVSN